MNSETVGPGSGPEGRERLARRVNELRRVLAWYFGEGPGRQGAPQRPFYCDPARVGMFTVPPADLAAGTDEALFSLFVSLSMYQALRDVVIMRQQRSMPGHAIRAVAGLALVKESIARHDCPALSSGAKFETECDVWKRNLAVDCETFPGVPCHVKAATVAFNRMGDMGKLPTSAYLRFWKDGGVPKALSDVRRETPSPTHRATLLVRRFTQVHRVGRKLATMFVSALSTPALAPGLTPWFPDVDGHELVVVDTNVARAVDTLREPGAARTYEARAHWVREQAGRLDLRGFRKDLPSYSPRLVQEALYAFCSRSNRVARLDVCGDRMEPCARCAPTLCPFGNQ